MKNFNYFLKILTVSIIPSLFLIIFRSDTLSLVRFFPDDAFYYLQTAWNFSRTGFISFDGTNSITGFHPLWLLVSSVLMFFANKHIALFVVFLFNSLSVATSLYFLSKTFLLFGRRPLSLGLVSVLTLPIFNFFLFTSSGMESGLLIISFSLFFYEFCKSLTSVDLNVRDACFVGITAGLVALSRLDSVVVLIFFGLYFLYAAWKMKRVYLAIAALISFVLVISPYFVWLWSVQENLMPMSSLAKYGRERWPFETVLRSLAGTNVLGNIFFVVPVLLNILALVTAPSERDSKNLVLMLKISAFAGLSYLLYVLFVAHEPYRWYLNITQIISLFCFAWLVSRTKYVDLFSLRFMIPVVLLANFGFLFLWSKMETTSFGLLKMTIEVNDLVPANAVIATNDSGVVGYFSTSKVHNLDGIANSLDNWKKYLSRLDYAGYFEEYSIDYMIIRKDFLTKDGVKNVFIYPNDTSSSCRDFSVIRFGDQVMCRVSK